MICQETHGSGRLKFGVKIIIRKEIIHMVMLEEVVHGIILQEQRELPLDVQHLCKEGEVWDLDWHFLFNFSQISIFIKS